MSYEAVLQIGKTEEAARAVIAEAQGKSRERLSQARSEAEQKQAAVKKQLSEQLAAAAGEQQQKDDLLAAGALRETQAECAELREKAAKNMPAAIARVMERVMS